MSQAELRPTTYEDVVEAVRAHPRLHLCGLGTQSAWVRPSPSDAVRIRLDGVRGIVSHDVADQVVTVRAGTRLDDLQAELAERDQCLPLGPSLVPSSGGSVGGQLAMGLPHTLEGATGTWRDWVLGLRFVSAQGELIKCGSKAVKSVAGYDIQRLMVGARGSLGAIVEVTLRTFPLRAMPRPTLIQRGQAPEYPMIIQRTLRTDFELALSGFTNVIGDPMTSTLWAHLPLDESPRRFPHDWCVRSHFAQDDTTEPSRWDFRLRSVLDPDGKFSPAS